MIRSFQGLRALVAIAVVAQHVTAAPGYLEQSNNAGISLLFVMSGFLLWSHRPAPGGRFFLDRLARLAPLNILGVVLAVLLALGNLPYVLPRAAVDLLMLQSWIPVRSWYYSCDPVAWFLSSILLCYALFPALSRILHAGARRFALVWLAAATAYTSVVALLAGDSQSLQAFVYVAPYSRVFDFALGMIAGMWSSESGERRAESREGKNRWGGQLVVMVVWVVAFVASVHVPEVLFLASWWYLPGALLLITLAGDRGPVATLLSVKPLVWLGDISFGVFMLHIPLLYAFRIVAAKAGFVPETWMMLAAVLTASIAAAWLVSRYFERPITRRLRKLIDR